MPRLFLETKVRGGAADMGREAQRRLLWGLLDAVVYMKRVISYLVGHPFVQSGKITVCCHHMHRFYF